MQESDLKNAFGYVNYYSEMLCNVAHVFEIVKYSFRSIKRPTLTHFSISSGSFFDLVEAAITSRFVHEVPQKSDAS